MEQTDFLQDERLQWLRFVLHPASPRPEIRDWAGLYQFARKQALLGFCSPTQFVGEMPPKEVLLKWYIDESMIRARNAVVNRQSAELTARLREAGLACCILKGQGNALLYPEPALRMSGDIDVWVDADRKTLREYVRKQFPDAEERYKHIRFPLFEDTPVDMHDTPLKLYHPVHNWRLQRWLKKNKGAQMAHAVRLAGTDVDIAVPTAAFNAVYQMGHILLHMEGEGIGLRQFVDYYYVLRALEGAGAEQLEAIRRMWRRLGLLRFARAVMWVEREMLGLEEKYLPVEPDERKGRLLADDILEGGNFGQHGEVAHSGRHGSVARRIAHFGHLSRLAVCFPGEAFFRICRKSIMFIKKRILIILYGKQAYLSVSRTYERGRN